MSPYKALALATAHERSYTAAEVQEKDYFGIAEMCGVTIEKNGNSPADFFYEPLRRFLVVTLEREEKAAALQARKIALEGVMALSPSLVAMKVTVDDEGNLKVSEDKDRLVVLK